MNLRIAAVAAIALISLATSAEARRSRHYQPQQPSYDFSAHTNNSYRTGIYGYYGPVSVTGGVLTNKQVSRKRHSRRHTGKLIDRGIREATSSRAYKRLNRKLVERTVGVPSARESGTPRYAKVHTSNGLTATVIASAKDKFQGFIDAVEEAGYKIGDMGCKSWGHMRNSKHHWGGACDFDQKRRSVTAKFMYHVTSIAKRFGLTDGCTWHPADCGHIEVPGPNSPHRNQYAMR